MDNFEKIEEYLESVEEYFFSSLSAVSHGLPDVHEAFNRLWIDMARYGPGMPTFPQVKTSSLGDFHVPPLPPPSPPPSSSIGSSAIGWVGRHPWKTTGIVVGVVGASLLVGYATLPSKRRPAHKFRTQSTTERKQVVVVLGGNSVLALPLILDLESKGYIVIVSVPTPEAGEHLESRCHGFVKALVLDPYEPATIPVFVRSLSSTLSRRFPITASGDPFASPSSYPYIHSIITLLTHPSTVTITRAPLEHISLRETYLPYLTATHIAPLQVIQALLPMLRTGPARSQDKGKKSIIVCLPATEAAVGLPFASIQAMSAASMLRGVEVLRREIKVAALTDKSESMKNIQVVVADLGTFSAGPEETPSENVYKAMENWTASEKVTYGPAFASIMHSSSRPAPKRNFFFAIFSGIQGYGIHRKPTDVTRFVNNVVEVVSGGRYGPSICGVDVGLGKLRNWMRGDRFSIGAGANTYRNASKLPSFLLDFLLNVPHILISLRNRLLMTQPFRLPPPTLPRDSNTGTSNSNNIEETQIEKLSVNDQADIETSSEPETEGSHSETVETSWVNLNKSSVHEP